MELRVLNYFLTVAREQNISNAAETLHITQPTLSRQLKDLEDELGKTLYHISSDDGLDVIENLDYMNKKVSEIKKNN